MQLLVIIRKTLLFSRKMKIYIIASLLVLMGLIFIITTNSLRSNSNQGFKDGFCIPISTPFTFKTDEAEQLSIKAFNLKESNEYDEAIQLYLYAIKVEPDNPQLFFDLSYCYSRMNKLEQAIKLLDTAITLDSSFAPFYNNRGLFYGNLGNNQQAICDFKKAIQLDSSNYIIYANFALSYLHEKDSLNACEAFRNSKRLGLTVSSLNSSSGLSELNMICK